MKVKDLPDWPPCSFSMSASGRGDRIPTHASQVTIGIVVNVLDNCVRFKCGFEDADVTCSFFVPDATMAKGIAAILESNKGKNLLSISLVEICDN